MRLFRSYHHSRASSHLTPTPTPTPPAPDLVHTRKASHYVEKFPLAAVFHEAKEKVLRAGAQKQMLGAYLNVDMDEKPFTVAPDGQASEEEGRPIKPVAPATAWETNRDYFRFPFPRDFAEGRPIELVPIPKHVEEKETKKKRRGR